MERILLNNQAGVCKPVAACHLSLDLSLGLQRLKLNLLANESFAFSVNLLKPWRELGSPLHHKSGQCCNDFIG